MVGNRVATLGLVAGTSVLASFVTATVLARPGAAQGEAARLSGGPAPGAEWAALLERLEAAASRRSALEGPSLPATRVAVEPAEVAPPDADDRRVERLCERILSELDQRGVVIQGSAPEPLPLDTPIHPAAIAQMIALHESGVQEAVKRELQLLTPREAMERFGRPSRADSSSAQGYDMWWCYDEPHATALELYFTGGYVTYAVARSEP